ncbi:hypothetical protein M877_20885 [Streptomyces niveus NCIMB 11891]|nr:hypothetical protein M877_20885 [Streptomyces niveus NCIMB 11891]
MGVLTSSIFRRWVQHHSYSLRRTKLRDLGAIP